MLKKFVVPVTWMVSSYVEVEAIDEDGAAHEAMGVDIDSLPNPVGLSMNCWRFSSSIFRACAKIEISTRGEYELTDAVQFCVDELGTTFRVITCNAAVLDLSRREDIASVKSRLLNVSVQL